jgi:UDP-3-O-[3-hydroxymyristoyl] glucosamine N-acyltransferase
MVVPEKPHGELLMQRITLQQVKDAIPYIKIANIVKTDFDFPSSPTSGDGEGFVFLEHEYLEKSLINPDQVWGACLIEEKSLDFLSQFQKGNNTILVVDNPNLTFAKIYEFLVDKSEMNGIHGYVHPSSTIGASSYLGIGSYVGPNCNIGEGVSIQPNVTIIQDVEIGNDVTIRSSSVIGSNGFGYVKDENGRNILFPQVGGVVIEDGVDIGSNTSIDGGALFPTIMRSGSKIDNLVHMAHGVEIENDCWIAPGAVIREHVTIGEHSFVGLGAVVTKSLPHRSRVIGNPARDFPVK